MDDNYQHGKLVGFFSKHLVPVYFTFRKGDKSHSGIVSAFLIAISDDWYLITAGHCIVQIEQNIEQGYNIDTCRLIDHGGLEATHFDSIPFDYLGARPLHFTKNGLDYGIIPIRNYYKVLLEKNGVSPLDEEVWEKQPMDPDLFVLIGIPSELCEVDEEKYNAKTTLHGIEEIKERPSCFPENDAPMFYGKIELGELSSIVGLSGGPVFSIKTDGQGNIKYWLHAVQSHWMPGQRYIAACLVTPFAAFVKKVVYE